MPNTETHFEKISFIQLLEQHPVEIPMIQRDYAQGRSSQKKMFINFLKALKDAVSGSPIELDFVYGDVKDYKFHPLDGQQRLTTLFLLHWYAAACSDSPKSHAEIIGSFSYCTRISSRDFCSQLLENIEDYSSIQLTPTLWIEDQTWFRSAWKKDPTVSGMLSALDSIHGEFNEIKTNLWGKLSDDRKITFYKTTLDKIGLSDDLYIKMNARGKALSPFENLKAQINRKIEKELWEKDLPHTAKFGHLIDTDWTNLIWKAFGKDKFDISFIRFLTNKAVYAIINDTTNESPNISGNSSKESSKPSVDIVIDQLIKDPTSLSIEHISKKVYETLYGSFSGLCQFDNQQLSCEGLSWFDMSPRIDDDILSIFECIGEPTFNPTMQQRLLSFAMYEYAQRHGKNVTVENYHNWMRFIRNIIQNSNINNLDRFISAARFIYKMGEGCGDIYSYLCQLNYEDKAFASAAVRREKQKAEMILVDGKLVNILHDLEDTKFCYGNLTFPFHYVSCIPDASKHVDRLTHVLNTISEYFKEEISDLHRRALLTVGDGSYYRYWWSWLHAAKGNKHRLIMNIGDLRENIYHNDLQKAFTGYFDLLEKYKPDQLIADFDQSDKEHWRYKIIKDSSLLQKSTYKYLTFSDDGKCYLIPKSKVENNSDGKSRLIEVGTYN